MQEERKAALASQGLWLVFILVGILAFAGLSQQARAGSFCPPREIREYAPPLKGMHPLPWPPYGGAKLPPGLPGVRIAQDVFSNIAVEGGEIGFYLAGYLEKPKYLGWKVERRLSAVDRKGRIQKILRKRIQRIGTLTKLSALKLAFKVGKVPRLYRIDITVLGLSGKSLAHYADYFRVMPREVDVRLGLNAATYRAGKVLLMRLEDLGTVGISFGLEFALDVWDGSSWTASPGAPLAWEQIGLGLGAGRTQQCQRFPLPEDLAPGRYRLTKVFSTSLGGPFSHVARAFFDVTA